MSVIGTQRIIQTNYLKNLKRKESDLVKLKKKISKKFTFENSLIMTNVFLEEMKYFVNTFQLFSFFPFSSSAVGNVLLKFYSVFSVFLVAGIFVSAFFIYPVLNDSKDLSLLVGGLVFNGLLITQIINILQAFSSRQDQMMIYQKFDEIDHMLQNQLLVTINYSSLRQRLMTKYFIIGLVLIVIHTTSIISTVANDLFFVYYLHLIIPIFVIRIRCLQKIFYVDLIKEKLNLMNKKLEDIIAKNRDKIIYVLASDKLQKFDKKGYKTSLYDQLMTLKQIYGKIWDVSNLINDCFGEFLSNFSLYFSFKFYRKEGENLIVYD